MSASDVVFREDGTFRFTYTDEASVRSVIAKVARAAGWFEVREEVQIPGWGTVDLVVRSAAGRPPVLIELKLELTRIANVRKAYQQVDGYTRGWRAVFGEDSVAMLSACQQDADSINRVGQAYPKVQRAPVRELINALIVMDERITERRDLSVARAADIRRELAFHDAVLAQVERNALCEVTA